MKKKIILIIFILLLIIIGVITSLTFIHKGKTQENEIYNEEDVITENEEVEETEPEYVDDNTVKLGIYVESGNNLVLTDEYYCDWSAENVMGLFYAIPTQEESIYNSNFDTMWKNYINEYPNADSCRIGYNIQFTLNTGEVIDSNIFNPDDAYYMFPKVMFFLYDDVNLVPGKAYYHITQDVMYDYTICSSAKLVGDVDTDNIVSDIKLTAFCFDSDDDFDPETGKYRGNSSYTITIKRK
jgi:uncharacterized protein YxeA